jgi:hypothetical protein
MDPETLTTPQIRDLVWQAEAARNTLGRCTQTLRHRLDFPARAKGSLSKHPGTWLLGSVGIGLLTSLALRRKSPRKTKKAHGMRSMLLGFAVAGAKPFLKTWLIGHLTRLTAGISNPPLSDSPNPASRNIL